METTEVCNNSKFMHIRVVLAEKSAHFSWNAWVSKNFGNVCQCSVCLIFKVSVREFPQAEIKCLNGVYTQSNNSYGSHLSRIVWQPAAQKWVRTSTAGQSPVRTNRNNFVSSNLLFGARSCEFAKMIGATSAKLNLLLLGIENESPLKILGWSLWQGSARLPLCCCRKTQFVFQQLHKCTKIMREKGNCKKQLGRKDSCWYISLDKVELQSHCRIAGVNRNHQTCCFCYRWHGDTCFLCLILLLKKFQENFIFIEFPAMSQYLLSQHEFAYYILRSLPPW